LHINWIKCVVKICLHTPWHFISTYKQVMLIQSYTWSVNCASKQFNNNFCPPLSDTKSKYTIHFNSALCFCTLIKKLMINFFLLFRKNLHCIVFDSISTSILPELQLEMFSNLYTDTISNNFPINKTINCGEMLLYLIFAEKLPPFK
jgi:hypothetical protein